VFSHDCDFTQRVGRYLYERRQNGLLVKSALCDGFNGAILTPRILYNPTAPLLSDLPLATRASGSSVFPQASRRHTFKLIHQADPPLAILQKTKKWIDTKLLDN
jgi:hypothetical protein